MRGIKRMIVLALLLVRPLAAQETSTAAIIARVNEARTAAGIPALLPSELLMAAAQAHSADMAATDTLSHTGSDGSQFWQRMERAGYALTTGAENVLFRYDTDAMAVFEQWRSSPAHNANMLNPAYVEVGVAYAAASNGKIYFTMVLGTRPGILPPPIGTPILAVPTNSATMTPFIPPPTLTPSPMPTATPTSTPLPTASATPTPAPTLASPPDARYASVAQAVQDTLREVENALLAEPATPPLLPTPIVFPTFAPTPFTEPDLLLVYNEDYFTLLNTSGTTQYLSFLYFESSAGSFSAERWVTPYLSQTLEAFTPDDCLQIWRTETHYFPAKPENCHTRHAYAVVSPAGQFWRSTNQFLVANNGQTVAICQVAAGSCLVDLSAALTPPALVAATPTPRANRDIRLYISERTVTLLNISGREVNVSELVFESATAVFAAWSWRIPELSRPLQRLTPSDCLQVWLVGISYLRVPEECQSRHAWLPLGKHQQFWVNTPTFTVRYGDLPLTTCDVSAGICEFNLP